MLKHILSYQNCYFLFYLTKLNILSPMIYSVFFPLPLPHRDSLTAIDLADPVWLLHLAPERSFAELNDALPIHIPKKVT